MIARQFSSEASWTPAIVPGLSMPYCQPTPALLTSTSTFPNASIAAATTLSWEVGSSRSAGTMMPSPPAALTLSSPSWSFDSVRAVPTTFAPSRPTISMVARPMPLLAPVMRTTLSCSRPARVGSCTASVRSCTLMRSPRPLAPARDARRVAGGLVSARGSGFVECTATFSVRGRPPRAPPRADGRAVRAGRSSSCAPRRGRRRGAACGCARTARRAGSRRETPPPPWTWIARSMTFSATCGAATLIAAISVRACLLPTVSISHAVLSVSRRAISISIRDSAIQSCTFARVATGAPKVTRSDARRHISSSARSAAPIVRMQWWMRPGPSRAWAIRKPSPSPAIRFAAGHAHVLEERARRGPRGRL